MKFLEKIFAPILVVIFSFFSTPISDSEQTISSGIVKEDLAESQKKDDLKKLYPRKYNRDEIRDCRDILITAVIDGDTFIARDLVTEKEFQIRILGANTTEVTTLHTEEECLAADASAMLSLLLTESRLACMQQDFTNQDEDAFGRKLRYVYIKNPIDKDGTYIDLSETMILSGYAVVLRKYTYVRKGYYIKKEEAAKEKRRNLRNRCTDTSRGLEISF